jgi:hypothetical protein
VHRHVHRMGCTVGHAAERDNGRSVNGHPDPLNGTPV